MRDGRREGSLRKEDEGKRRDRRSEVREGVKGVREEEGWNSRDGRSEGRSGMKGK
jgi:hypothetical protein